MWYLLGNLDRHLWAATLSHFAQTTPRSRQKLLARSESSGGLLQLPCAPKLKGA